MWSERLLRWKISRAAAFNAELISVTLNIYGVAIVTTLQPVVVYMLGLGLGLVLGLFLALLDMFRTRSPMIDRLQRRNNSHGPTFNDVAGSHYTVRTVAAAERFELSLLSRASLRRRQRVANKRVA